MDFGISQATLDLARAAWGATIPASDIQRAFTSPASATQGLIAYDLEAPSKKLYPLLTPLRNKIARRADGYSIQSNWEVVNGINITNLDIGVSERNRGGVINQSTARYMAAFVECGLETYATWKADLASKNYEDVKALAQIQLLQSCMIQEEFLDLGGMATIPMGQTPTPTVTDAGAALGTLLHSQAYYVGCVALNLKGYQQLAGWNMGITGQSMSLTTALVQQITRANADGSSDTYGAGVAIPSAACGTVTTGTQSSSADTHAINATVTPLNGAVGYAWYMGTSAATAALVAVTTTGSVTITSLPAAGAQLFSALAATDYSCNSLVYDGMLTQLYKAGSGATINTLANGAKLTSNGYGGITEFDTVFTNMFNLYRTGPDEIYVNIQQLMDINALVISGGGAPLFRFNLDGNNPGNIDAGIVVGSILNPATNRKVQILVHPNMPPGTIMFWSNSVPYPLNDIGSLVLKHLRRDYYAIEWPFTKRSYDYGVYFDGVLKNYFPPAFAIVNNITQGH